MTIDFDLILPDVGEYGKYQKLMVWFVFLPGMIPCGFHAYNQLFMATLPKFRCLVPDLDLVERNYTDDFIRNIGYLYFRLPIFLFIKIFHWRLSYLWKNQCLSIPFVINKEGRWDSSSCSMYARNYSAEENLDALFQHGGNLSSDIPTVPCQAGWKFQYNDQESTTVVAEVSFVFCQIYA